MRIGLCLVLLAASGICIAGPADYVFTPDIEHGETEIDLVAGWASEAGGDSRAFGAGIGRGFTPYFFSELFLIVSGDPRESTRLEGFEWESRVRVGEFRNVSVGFVTELEIPRDSADARELKFGAMVQRMFGATQANLNVLVERAFGGDSMPGKERETVLGYQWQLRRHSSPNLSWGVQGSGEVGPWNSWDNGDSQEHLIGPAVFGRIPIGEEALKFNAGWLVGASAAAPDHTLRLQVEIEL